MISPIMTSPMHDSVLRNECESIIFSKADPDNLQEICQNLIDTVQKVDGYGLSAPQIGIARRVFVINSKFVVNNYSMYPIIVINPVITMRSVETSRMLEGCLSLPGKEFLIERPAIIEAKYFGKDGSPRVGKFRNVSARVFQHEYDHLDGMMIDELSNLQGWEQTMRKSYDSDNLL